MSKIKSIRKNIINGKISIDKLIDIREDLEREAKRFMDIEILNDDDFHEMK